MSNRGLWLEGGTTFPDLRSRVLAGVLALAWVLLIGARSSPPAFTSHDQCGTDPWDILRIGELVDPRSLRFLIEAHCANARYAPDGWIELRFGGARIDVETRRLTFGGNTYYQIVSIGGSTEP